MMQWRIMILLLIPHDRLLGCCNILMYTRQIDDVVLLVVMMNLIAQQRSQFTGRLKSRRRSGRAGHHRLAVFVDSLLLLMLMLLLLVVHERLLSRFAPNASNLEVVTIRCRQVVGGV